MSLGVRHVPARQESGGILIMSYADQGSLGKPRCSTRELDAGLGRPNIRLLRFGLTESLKSNRSPSGIANASAHRTEGGRIVDRHSETRRQIDACNVREARRNRYLFPAPE